MRIFWTMRIGVLWCTVWVGKRRVKSGYGWSWWIFFGCHPCWASYQFSIDRYWIIVLCTGSTSCWVADSTRRSYRSRVWIFFSTRNSTRVEVRTEAGSTGLSSCSLMWCLLFWFTGWEKKVLIILNNNLSNNLNFNNFILIIIFNNILINLNNNLNFILIKIFNNLNSLWKCCHSRFR